MALGAPRRALSLLAGCHHCETRDDAIAVYRDASNAANQGVDLGFRVAQALSTPRWADLRVLLSEIDEVGDYIVGTVRQVVRSYYKKVILTSKEKQQRSYARMIMSQFEEPFTDTESLVFVVDHIAEGGSGAQD
jgi:hypothetical protein